jgi:hypothetical protein
MGIEPNPHRATIEAAQVGKTGMGILATTDPSLLLAVLLLLSLLQFKFKFKFQLLRE